LHNLVEQIGVVQEANEFGKLEVVKNLAGVFGKTLDVALQISLDARLAQGAEIHGRGVEEGEVGSAQEQLFLGLLGNGHLFHLGCFGQHRGLAALQHTFQAAQQRKGEDDAAILALPEVAAQQVGQCPKVGGEVVGFLGHDSVLLCFALLDWLPMLCSTLGMLKFTIEAKSASWSTAVGRIIEGFYKFPV
jgi:hypothetical protein